MSQDEIRIGQVVKWDEDGNTRIGKILHAAKFPMVMVQAFEGDKPYVESGLLSVACYYDVERWTENK